MTACLRPIAFVAGLLALSGDVRFGEDVPRP